jgi:MoaA/NifB/PqqE/SkfB family radical SAM enzyme
MANIALLNCYARERGVHRTKMWTVVQQGNLHELEALVDHAVDLGFSNQVFSLELTDFGLTAGMGSTPRPAPNRASISIFCSARCSAARSAACACGFGTRRTKYSTDSPEALCPWPFERVYISSDRRVVPCCFIGDPDVAEGTTPGEPASFASVWFGADFRAFRQAHLDGDIPGYCRGCYRAGWKPVVA